MMKNTCRTCEFWRAGECVNPKVREKLFTYDYQIVFSPDFGCIFWEMPVKNAWDGDTVDPPPYKSHTQTKSES
jgi:hypothetical protein